MILKQLIHMNPTEGFLAELLKLNDLKFRKPTLYGNEIQDKRVIVESGII